MRQSHRSFRASLSVVLGCLGLSGSAWAAELQIESFRGTGQLSFSEIATATSYRVEWAPTPAGPWTNSWDALRAIPATGSGSVTCSVPMCYRVVAAVTNPPYLVVDVSGGPAATNYPVSYLMAVPDGGWTDQYKTTRIVFRCIPAGTYLMGSPAGEVGRATDEPRHQVTLSQGFYLGVFEVTQKQWERVTGTWPAYFNNAGCCDARPVEQVSYGDIRGSSAGANWPATNSVDAASFLGKLRARTGIVFDLPTESQWEYACRADTTNALNSGHNLTSTGDDPWMDEVGRYWYNGGSAYTQGGDTSVGTAKAGMHLVNAWGLYDMHGNTWEWCLDWYDTYPGTTTDPKGATSGSARCIRGGSWGNGADFCRSANRDSNIPGYHGGNTGFRVAAPPAQ